MNQELFGIGRTWLVALVLLVLSTAMLYTDKITTDIWVNIIMFAFGGGTIKSTLIGVSNTLSKKKGVKE